MPALFVLLAACAESPRPEAPVAVGARLTTPPADVEGPILAVSGDVNLGRRQNALTAASGPAKALGAVPEFAAADLTYVNLECVVATGGDYRVEKGERGPYYYRGRPEMAAILDVAGVDVVGTANNHTGDYGPPALLEALRILDTMGVGHPGSGPTLADACAPVFRHVGALTVAFVAVDGTMPSFAATATRPGVCELPMGDAAAWARFAETQVAVARERADVVLLGAHWGDNQLKRPTAAVKAAARAAIRGGFDAILGSHAHVVQGIEVIDGRPVLYDTGNLLFDTPDRRAGARFELVLSPGGVREVRVSPLAVRYGYTEPADAAEAAKTVERLAAASQELGTAVWADEQQLRVPLPEPPARPPPPQTAPADPPRVAAPQAATEPPPQCVTDTVPPELSRLDAPFGPVTLLAARVGPKVLPERGMIDVETWWRVEEPPPAGSILMVTATPTGFVHDAWGGTHDGCDWAWPLDRWKPGTIYVDRYALRPGHAVHPGAYAVTVTMAAPAVHVAPLQLDTVRLEAAGPEDDGR